MYILSCTDKSICSYNEQTEADLAGNRTFRHI